MTANDVSSVAKWMANQIEEHGELSQEDAKWEIERQFGDDFLHQNNSGNWVINPQVLKAFRRLTEQTVVWEKRERLWRRRAAEDAPGRIQE